MLNWYDMSGRSTSFFWSWWNSPVLIKSLFLLKSSVIPTSWTFPRNTASRDRSIFKTLSQFFFSCEKYFGHLAVKYFLFQVCYRYVSQFSGRLREELRKIYLNPYLSENVQWNRQWGVYSTSHISGDCMACGKNRTRQFLLQVSCVLLIHGWAISRSRWTDPAQTQHQNQNKDNRVF